MIGIYKITNLINGKSYIGQSRDIENRWKNHKIAASNQNSKAYNYPLYQAFRKYGLNNFQFEVIEETAIDELNSKEIKWIEFYQPEYNQTIGGNYCIVPQKLTEKQANEIQEILLDSERTGIDVSHTDLAKLYQVHISTIQSINVGRSWIREDLVYPLHNSKYSIPTIQNYCIDCGKEIFKSSTRCVACENARRRKNSNEISRDALKNLIRNKTFTEIGKQFNVSDNAVKKWCKKYNLPHLKSEIKKYSDEEWMKI